jgi:hypothetical protein
MRNREAGTKAAADAEDAPKPPPGVEELKRLRREEIDRLAQAAADGDAALDRVLARVQSLSAAIDAIEKAGGKARNRRPTIVICAAAVLLTGTLLLLHRSSTEILVDAKASGISFTVAHSFALLRGIVGLQSVELSGLVKIKQEDAPDITAETDDDLRVRLANDTTAKEPGSIGFDSLLVPTGTQIEFLQTGTSKLIGIRIQYPAGTSPAIDMDVSGGLLMQIGGQRERKTGFPAPARITAVPAGDARLLLGFDSPVIEFPVPIPTQSILWARDARTPSDHPGAVRSQSTVISGKLSFEEFRDKFVSLRDGEPLNLGGASGRIRQLRFDGQTISCEFDGAAQELSIGEGGRRQNLMPTWLEWIRQQDALLQFWAASAYLAGLGLAVGRWWGESE